MGKKLRTTCTLFFLSIAAAIVAIVLSGVAVVEHDVSASPATAPALTAAQIKAGASYWRNSQGLWIYTQTFPTTAPKVRLWCGKGCTREGGI
jgi:hypothetical protein